MNLINYIRTSLTKCAERWANGVSGSTWSRQDSCKLSDSSKIRYSVRLLTKQRSVQDDAFVFRLLLAAYFSFVVVGMRVPLPSTEVATMCKTVYFTAWVHS